MSDRPFDISLIPRPNKYVVTLPYRKSIQFISSDLEPGRTIDLQCRFKPYGIAATHQVFFVGECQTIHILDINAVKMKYLRMTEAFCIFIVDRSTTKFYMSYLQQYTKIIKTPTLQTYFS